MIVKARMRGGLELVNQTLVGLPGNHVVDEIFEDDIYTIITNNAGFLTYAITKQGYGEILTES